MKVLVTGSAGHLGEALVRRLRDDGLEVLGVDIKASETTTHLGSITHVPWVRQCLAGVDTIYHTATLHKPHVATHSIQAFIDTNISGTSALLEASVEAGVRAFVFTSTTSVFGDALRPPPGTPAAWITETVTPIPKNIYGVTKTAAEELCWLFHRNHKLPCVILRTSRFFPEADDDRQKRAAFADDNLKANEYLFRRVEISDVVDAHLLASQRAPALGFGRYIISATSPFEPDDVAELNTDAARVVQRRVPEFPAVYQSLDWRMFETIDRVYVNDAARRALGWTPKYDFGYVLDKLKGGELPRSNVARVVGSKGYHDQVFEDGPFPVQE